METQSNKLDFSNQNIFGVLVFWWLLIVTSDKLSVCWVMGLENWLVVRCGLTIDLPASLNVYKY